MFIVSPPFSRSSKELSVELERTSAVVHKLRYEEKLGPADIARTRLLGAARRLRTVAKHDDDHCGSHAGSHPRR